jgi:hypothetical protein
MSTPKTFPPWNPEQSSTTLAQGWCAASGRHDLGAADASCRRNGTGNAQGKHPGERQGPGQRVEAALAALSQQLQQLDQLLPPGLHLPEHGEGLVQGPPAPAGTQQLGAEHPPLAPMALAEPLGIAGRGSREGRGGGALLLGMIEVQQWLRHAGLLPGCESHRLERGQAIRSIQELLGHCDV